jgi:hypothetical protein
MAFAAPFNAARTLIASVNVQRGPSGKSKAPPLVATWAERLPPHFSCSINPYRIVARRIKMNGDDS